MGHSFLTRRHEQLGYARSRDFGGRVRRGNIGTKRCQAAAWQLYHVESRAAATNATIVEVDLDQSRVKGRGIAHPSASNLPLETTLSVGWLGRCSQRLQRPQAVACDEKLMG